MIEMQEWPGFVSMWLDEPHEFADAVEYILNNIGMVNVETLTYFKDHTKDNGYIIQINKGEV